MDIWEVDAGGRSVDGLLADGSPDPEYAEALGLVPAPLGRRAAAFVIDVVPWVLLQVPFWLVTWPLLLKYLTDRISWYGLVNHPDFFVAVLVGGISLGLTLVYCIVQSVLHGRKGFTLGKALLGLRTVNVVTLERPGFWRVVLRFVVLEVSSIVPLLVWVFLASPAFDKEKRGRGWHDRVGRTWLVDVRRGLHPYDEKRMRIARKTVAATPREERRALRSLTDADAERALQDFRPSERLSAGVLGNPDLKPSPQQSARGGQAGGALATPTGGSLATPAGGSPVVPAATPASAPSLATPPVTPQAMPPVVPNATPSATPQPTPSELSPGPLATPPSPAASSSPIRSVPSSTQSVPTPAPSPSAATPAPAPATQRFLLRMDTTQEIVVDRPMLLGRNPQSTDPTMKTVAIRDDEFSVSKIHLLVRPAGQGLEVIDRGSSNGTTLTHGGVQHTLVPGQPMLAQPGDTLQIGQRTAQLVRG